MTVSSSVRWDPDSPPPALLGAVAHGPALLARSVGIAVGLRYVHAYPTGLVLAVVVQAVGVQAEAAGRQQGHGDGGARYRWSQLSLTVRLDGRDGVVHPRQASASWGDDHYASDQQFFVPALPADGQLSLTVGWPEAGLTPASVTLDLDLADLEARVVALL